jgi:hypothetical protein
VLMEIESGHLELFPFCPHSRPRETRVFVPTKTFKVISTNGKARWSNEFRCSPNNGHSCVRPLRARSCLLVARLFLRRAPSAMCATGGGAWPPASRPAF